MQRVSFVIACLACAGHGRRVQTLSQHLSGMQSLAELQGTSKGRAKDNPFSKLFGEKKPSDEDAESTASSGDDADESKEGFDWEKENLARFRAGEINDAELGMANLQAAMNDPAVLEEVAQMLKDPEYQAQLQRMMSDPAFQEQARQAAEQLKVDPEYEEKIKKVMEQTSAGLEDDIVGASMKKAMTDPAVLENAMETLKDPEQLKQIKKMMADPEVQKMQKKMAAQMQEMMSDPQMMEQMEKMMSDPNFQEQAKKIAEQMQAAVSEEDEDK